MTTIKKLPVGTRVRVIDSRYKGKEGWINRNDKASLTQTHYAVNLDPANRSAGPVVYLGHHQVEEVPTEV